MQLAEQVAWAAAYYVYIIVAIRMAGKRLAGQTATFDLIILIAIAFAFQKIALLDGIGNTMVFIVTVFALHLMQTMLSTKYRWFRSLVRGKPRPLVRNGTIDRSAMAEEFFSIDDLMAGLRKQGITSLAEVKLAMLEDTGAISVARA